MIVTSSYRYHLTKEEEEEEFLKLLNQSKCSLCDFFNKEDVKCGYFNNTGWCLPNTYRKKA